VVSRIFEPTREEGAGGWRRLHNEEFHNLYTCIIRVMKLRRMMWTGHIAFMGEMRNVHKILVRKPEGEIPFGRPMCR